MTDSAIAFEPREDRRRSGRAALGRFVVVVAAIGVVGLLVLTTSRAAFNDTTDNGPNSFTAGDVVLNDDDAGNVMFDLAGMKPGDTATKCINVTYTGSLPADVKLYGTVGGTGLATYLDTVIDIGTGAGGGTNFDCGGFKASANLHTATLDVFGTTNTDYATGLGGFDGATNPTTMSYQFTVTLQDNNAAQGLDATATFTWEARNT